MKLHGYGYLIQTNAEIYISKTELSNTANVVDKFPSSNLSTTFAGEFQADSG